MLQSLVKFSLRFRGIVLSLAALSARLGLSSARLALLVAGCTAARGPAPDRDRWSGARRRRARRTPVGYARPAGAAAEEHARHQAQLLADAAAVLKVRPEDLPARLQALVDGQRKIEKELSDARKAL